MTRKVCEGREKQRVESISKCFREIGDTYWTQGGAGGEVNVYIVFDGQKGASF